MTLDKSSLFSANEQTKPLGAVFVPSRSTERFWFLKYSAVIFLVGGMHMYTYFIAKAEFCDKVIIIFVIAVFQ